MKYRIEIVPDQTEDLLISARESSPVLERIEKLLRETPDVLYGYGEEGIVRLTPEIVYGFFTEGNRVYASVRDGKLQVKERLYTLEEMFPEDFVKVNQSCLINIAKIRKFDTSIGGSLLVILQNGFRDYVSRRQMKIVKERLGL